MPTDPRAVLAAIQARADAATEGPWARMTDGCGCVVTDEWTIAQHGDNPRWSQTAHDGAFIAAARTDVPALISALGAVLDLADRHDTATTPAEWLADDIRAVIAEHLGGGT